MARLGYGPESSYGESGESGESGEAHSPQKHCAMSLCCVPGYGTHIFSLLLYHKNTPMVSYSTTLTSFHPQ